MRRIVLVMVALLVIAVSIVQSAPTQQANVFELFISQARADLELLADEVIGAGVRPPNWTFNFEWASETAVVDLWFDNESLAEAVFGVGVRPPAWFGATTNDIQLLARNVRHDLELTADEVLGSTTTRPDNWFGAAPIYRCDRTVQNTIRLLGSIYNTQDSVSLTLLSYCDEVRDAIVNNLIGIVYNPTQNDVVANQNITDQTLAIRGDLERLANELFGVNVRPNGWIWQVGMDGTTPTLAVDINADFDLLLTERLPASQRPSLLPGLTASSAITARNLRYNLEAIADTLLGRLIRPNGWQGVNPVERCDPLIQGVVVIAQRNYAFVVDETLGTSPDFCDVIGFTANSVVENPPPPEAETVQVQDSRYLAESRNAFSYLDVGTRQYMGIMPHGTEFRAWYRNYGESNMMFVSGEDFALYVDRRWTTMEIEVFRTLPTLDGVRPLTFCDARWCNGPGPTPTPTSDGPLLALYQGTPVPGSDVVGQPTLESGSKLQVSWNYIRVTYLLDRPEAGVVQVALEICAEPQQINCEPVLSVFDNNLGVAKPVLSNFNGLNVYEFTYGYTANLRIDGATRFSPDVWISDPTIR
ncbi:MAG: hypothetical protein KJ043_08480 [Anaerolineae bacterium]|nr:hypothetical protein [Anaerolineae bacterium]